MRTTKMGAWKNRGRNRSIHSHKDLEPFRFYTFAEYYRSIKQQAAKNTSFWILTKTPLPKGFVVWPRTPPTGGAEKHYQHFFMENFQPLLQR